MTQILNQVCQDLVELISYIPLGLFSGGMIMLVSTLHERRYFYRSKTWDLALFGAYLAVMLNFAFFSRAPGSRTSVDLIPFATWGTTAASRAFVIENILMFIPMGWLLPKVIGKLKKWHLCVLAGFIFSVGLELAQFLTGRGYCQTDDVVMNTLGTGIGWLLSYRYNTRGK